MELIQGKIKRTHLSEEQVTKVVKKIVENLDRGDSINVARKKVMDQLTKSDRRRIITHPEHVKALNAYLVRVGKGFQYEVVNGLLEVIKLNKT